MTEEFKKAKNKFIEDHMFEREDEVSVTADWAYEWWSEYIAKQEHWNSFNAGKVKDLEQKLTMATQALEKAESFGTMSPDDDINIINEMLRTLRQALAKIKSESE